MNGDRKRSQLHKTSRNLIRDSRQAHSPGVSKEDHLDNPLYTIRRMLNKAMYDANYWHSETFTGIVLKKIIYNIGDKNIADVAPLRLETTSMLDDSFTGPVNPTLYVVYIPELDKAVPLPKHLDDDATGKLTETKDRISVYYGSQNIEAGYLVKVAGPINSQRKLVHSEITTVISDRKLFDFDKEPDALEAFKKCVEEMSVKVPPVKASQSSPSAPIATTEPATRPIYSYRDFPEKSPKLFPIEKQNNTPVNNPEQQKQETIDKTQIKLSDVTKKCADVKSISPAAPGQTENDKPSDKAFLKDGLRLKLSEIPRLNKKFDYKTYVVEAVEDINNSAVALLQPPEVRPVNMIVIKEAPYMTLSDYYQGIKLNKSYAAHFCIDYNGDIYQLTDTCNIIKSYNPTIDEASIQIAMLNISFRNSPATNAALAKKSNKAGEDFDIGVKYWADKMKLMAFYKNKGINKNEVYSVGVTEKILRDAVNKRGTAAIFEFQDLHLWNKKIKPNYRLDFTEEQKLSLAGLLEAINNAYEVPLEIPKGVELDKENYIIYQQLEPDVMSGNFSGICCPYHFLPSSTEGLFNLHLYKGVYLPAKAG